LLIKPRERGREKEETAETRLFLLHHREKKRTRGEGPYTRVLCLVVKQRKGSMDPEVYVTLYDKKEGENKAEK